MAERWRGIAEAALELGVSGQTLRNAINKAANFASAEIPALAHKTRGKLFLVSPVQAYEHLRQWCPKINVQRPAGMEQQGIGDKEQGIGEENGQTVAPANADDLYKQLLVIVGKAGNNEDKRTLAAIANAWRLKEKDDWARENSIDVEEHVSKLREIGDTWAGAVFEVSETVADDVVRRVQADSGIDLVGQNVAFKDILRAALCKAHNEVVIPRVKRHVDEQIEGVKEMF